MMIRSIVQLGALVVALACSPAWAAGGYGLAVGATVLSNSNCKFTSGAGSTLAFGSIDPSSGTNVTASVILVMKCAGGAASAAYAVTSNDGLSATGPGQPRLQHSVSPANFLAYTLNTPISGVTPKNTATNVTITGTITVANFQNAIAGNYADTVVLTLAP